MPDERKKGFYDLCNLLNKYKRPVSMLEIIKAVNEEGWYQDFMKIGKKTIARQFNNHNAKYGSADMIDYEGR